LTFRYFAYGSNMWPPQLKSRCPTATPIGRDVLEGWSRAYDKPSTDGSAKLNIRPSPGESTEGVVYEVADADRDALDAAEPRYEAIETPVGLTYTYTRDPTAALPFDWYVRTAEKGAELHGVHIEPSAFDVDPVASDVRPSGEGELPLMQSILSRGLSATTTRYYVHPGELGWWMYHWDERRRSPTWWIQNDEAFVVVDPVDPGEISIFGLPGVDLWPLIRWSRRRLGGKGEVTWVSDRDREFESELEANGFAPTYNYRAFEWDLTSTAIPAPKLPDGWSIRHVEGEHEADNRRAASHAAFESSMPPDQHLQRYLRFMRSPVYTPKRDLVVVHEDGTIGSFMVWWADESGVAQIEPFGTHPDFHRQGLGRALLHHGLRDMKAAGMHLSRVMTDEDRAAATTFYEAAGFEVMGKLS